MTCTMSEESIWISLRHPSATHGRVSAGVPRLPGQPQRSWKLSCVLAGHLLVVNGTGNG